MTAVVTRLSYDIYIYHPHLRQVTPGPKSLRTVQFQLHGETLYYQRPVLLQWTLPRRTGTPSSTGLPASPPASQIRGYGIRDTVVDSPIHERGKEET